MVARQEHSLIPQAGARCVGSSFPGSARERAVWQAPPADIVPIERVATPRGRASTAVRSRAEPGNEETYLSRATRAPPPGRSPARGEGRMFYIGMQYRIAVGLARRQSGVGWKPRGDG